MNSIGQDSRNSNFPSASDPNGNANFFAFFGKPTPENLACNHNGILSLQQREALERLIANQRSTIVIVGGMLALAASFMGFLFWKIDASDGAISLTSQMINAVVLFLIVGLFAGIYLGDSFVFFMGDDLANGTVESSIGRVEWSGKRYQMQAGDRRLRSLRSTVALPPPGAYRFYYLPFTGLVVMAEELRGGQVENTMSGLLQALAAANRFSERDLKLNQNGVLAAEQETRLLLRVASPALILVLGVVLVVSAGSQIVYLTSGVTFLLLLIMAAVLILRLGWSAIMSVADVWNGKVVSVDGHVMRETRHSRYGRSYYYVIDGHRFQVSEAAYYALIEGNSCRVYYVPRSRQLVSIEPLL